MRLEIFIIGTIVGMTFGLLVASNNSTQKKLDGVIKNQEMLIDCMIFNRCTDELPPFMRPKQ